jgi:hypothetical protein
MIGRGTRHRTGSMPTGALCGRPVEIRENGGRLAPFSGASWEVRGAAEKPLLHLWSEYCNLTRRVLAISARSDGKLSLAVERFGRTKPDHLEFIRMHPCGKIPRRVA